MSDARAIPAVGLAVMVSGGGRSLDNLFKRIDSGELPGRIVLVIASRECPGAEIARGRGVATEVIPGVIPVERLAGLLERHGVRWLVLAGYLKLVRIPPAFNRRVVNIHPALLPKFGGAGMYGRRVHEAVLAAGERESGCTVHLCDDRFDTGPIVLQARVPVVAGDTPETLAARVFEAEKDALPRALTALIAGEAG